jgi:hypothetical protein
MPRRVSGLKNCGHIPSLSRPTLVNDPAMLRRAFVAMLTVGLFGTRDVLASPKAYKYRCMKCKLIQEYGTPGVKKCPNDGTTMIRMN